MVCDTSNFRIHVFDLNGKFVGKYGSEGSNLGEFKSTQSLAVLSNSRIVVCDRNNNRIQILWKEVPDHTLKKTTLLWIANMNCCKADSKQLFF